MVRAKIMSAIAIGWCAISLSACASNANFPALPGLGGMGQTTLTPEEQQAKIKELANAQAATGASVQPAVMTAPVTPAK